jgi:hypothetical protein
MRLGRVLTSNYFTIEPEMHTMEEEMAAGSSAAADAAAHVIDDINGSKADEDPADSLLLQQTLDAAHLAMPPTQVWRVVGCSCVCVAGVDLLCMEHGWGSVGFVHLQLAMGGTWGLAKGCTACATIWIFLLTISWLFVSLLPSKEFKARACACLCAPWCSWQWHCRVTRWKHGAAHEKEGWMDEHVLNRRWGGGAQARADSGQVLDGSSFYPRSIQYGAAAFAPPPPASASPLSTTPFNLPDSIPGGLGCWRWFCA